MDADSDDHRPEREMVDAVYLQMLEAIVIQEPVVYPFTSGTVFVDILEQVGIPWYGGMKAEVSMLFDIYRPAIGARRAFGLMRACVQTAAS